MKRVIEKVVEHNKRLEHLSTKEREFEIKLDYLYK
jgi:hypothetical protein